MKQDIDARCDLFATGVTLYECVTGSNPFLTGARDPLEVFRRVESQPLPRLALTFTHAADFADFISAMTQKRRTTARRQFKRHFFGSSRYATPRVFRFVELFLHVGMFTAFRRKRLSLHWGSRLMELYLQFGYGMMEHCRSLIADWGGGTAILSPRDLTHDQLLRLAQDVHKLPGGNVLVDPQFYLPHADHERLCQHDYWPKSYSTTAFWQGTALNDLLTKLLKYNDELGAQAFVLPGLLADTISDDWLGIQESTLAEASNVAPVELSTRPLPSVLTLQKTQIK